MLVSGCFVFDGGGGVIIRFFTFFFCAVYIFAVFFFFCSQFLFCFVFWCAFVDKKQNIHFSLVKSLRCDGISKQLHLPESRVYCGFTGNLRVASIYDIDGKLFKRFFRHVSMGEMCVGCWFHLVLSHKYSSDYTVTALQMIVVVLMLPQTQQQQQQQHKWQPMNFFAFSENRFIALKGYYHN